MILCSKEQIRLHNSTSKKKSEQFNEVFKDKDQFTKMKDTNNVIEMRQKIEEAFTMPNDEKINPLIENEEKDSKNY